jgi:hypothetical protein
MKQLLQVLFTILFFTACSSETAVDVTPRQDVSTGSEESAAIEDIPHTEQEVSDVSADAVSEAVTLLQRNGYFVTKGIDVLDRPTGFPEQDEFPLEPHEFSTKDGGAAEEACKTIAERELKAIGALDQWYKPVYRYCRHRVMNSSRAWQLGKQIESKVDGTPVHDRDRPSGHYFYKLAKAEGVINPDVCPYHALPPLHVEHPAECQHLAQHYEDRFKTPLDPKRKARWLENSHAYEQFTARGIVDFNVLYAYRTIGGCYPFTAFDRTDVAVTAVVRRSIRICAKYGCDNVNTIQYIKPHWNEAI